MQVLHFFLTIYKFSPLEQNTSVKKEILAIINSQDHGASGCNVADGLQEQSPATVQAVKDITMIE